MSKQKWKTTVQAKEPTPPAEENSADETASGSHIEPEESTQRVAVEMADLQMILQELRDFRRENGDALKEIKEDIKTTNNRVDKAENRISEAEERTQVVEEAVLEVLKLQEKLEARLTDQEGRSRRENIRIHGIKEGAENNSPTMATFVENLLREKLGIPASTKLELERAHRSLGPKPPLESPPRSIVVKFSSFKTKEEVLKLAWQRKGFVHQERKVILDHDYAPEVLRKWREYTEAKRVLRENKLRFQTPFPAKLRVFYEEKTCMYNSGADATQDMARRGLLVWVYKPPVSWADKIKTLMWHIPWAHVRDTKINWRPLEERSINMR